ncbi:MULTISPECIES: FitA-like ribbon-helix-helix domain-containing protein [Protofrankia]|uniref:Antitoxin n=1 Tax=Protofrankia coriariae TaxID=1562887 RepID=A0ABR5EZH7_9ACTN|nr:MULTISPECIES: ribbon-helix-helix protein, CopG family [Protofrankia]KLL09856.1 antitoxin [Protofrankia coriariae]ONH32689.1 antitoxin [Protofrankia sp. BMG5.30]
MSDVLIRDVPDDVLAAVEAHAARLGLSRNEYLRRQLAQDAARSVTPVTLDDLRWFSTTFRDLADPEAMRQAWA